MHWSPLTDLTQAELESLTNLSVNDELQALSTVWQEQATRLRESGTFKKYLQQLIRELAIETGIIERLYTIDRGATRLLIEHGIKESLLAHGTTDKPPKQVIALIKDQEAAINGLFDFVGGQRELSTSYIKQLHQLLTQNQPYTEALNPITNQYIQIPLLSGTWKKHPNNPQRPDGTLHQYAPPEQVTSEMDRLLDYHQKHQKTVLSPVIEAAWLHHRFTQIHPFQDGNGRVARCLATLIFIKANWFPLLLTRDDRHDYILALEQADNGDLIALVELFGAKQKRAFIRSLSLSEQVMAQSPADAIIADIAQRLKANQKFDHEHNKQLEQISNRLANIAFDRCSFLEEELKQSLAPVTQEPMIAIVTAAADPPARTNPFTYQILETAKQLNYHANLQTYHNWVRITIYVARPTSFLFSFHILGSENRGLYACSATVYHQDNNGGSSQSITNIQTLTNAPFQFAYTESAEKIIARFTPWLENAIVTGLEYWRKAI
ncbi:MAG TPA: Fic family protein [Anaerolineae bacterium]|nr:Fic family protein [Anaerolineae bacterium]